MNLLRVIWALVFGLGIQVASAQTDMSKNVETTDSLEGYMQPQVLDNAIKVSSFESVRYDALGVFSRSIGVEPSKVIPLQFSSLTPGQALIASWGNGGLSASGAMMHNPGLMGVEHGGMALTQTFDRLTMSLIASADKYGYFRGLQSGYGIGVNLDYQISSKLSLTLFGNYYTQLIPLTPAMAGYFNAPNFGGYLSYDFDERWGVSVGARSERSFYNGRWDTRPIVMPYYKLSKNVKIEADLGGILYEVVRLLANPSLRPDQMPLPRR